MTTEVDKPTEDELDMLRKWHSFNENIKRFQNNFNMWLSNEIFGDEEGERLFLHFRLDCQNNYEKFKTYLTVDQSNTLLIAILRHRKFKG